MSNAVAARRATLDDLLKVDGKAELIRGEIVHYMPTGFIHGVVVGRIARRLADHVDGLVRGYAFGDSVGFAVPELPSGRESFSPDAAYYTGAPPADISRFVPGPPDFAVEVRSRGDTGPAAEREMAAKRADYFAAGTLVVWDVDPVENVVRRYTADGAVATFGQGDEADAEPAVPGWRVAVDWLMG